MKKTIKKLLREGLITERLTDVESDVNLLYDMYFRPAVEEIERTGKITEDMFNYAETNTVILESELAKEYMPPCGFVYKLVRTYFPIGTLKLMLLGNCTLKFTPSILPTLIPT